MASFNFIFSVLSGVVNYRPFTKQKLASKNVTYSNQIYTDRRRIIKNFTSRTIAYFPPCGFMISK